MKKDRREKKFLFSSNLTIARSWRNQKDQGKDFIFTTKSAVLLTI
jgi:hypothetical protein